MDWNPWHHPFNENQLDGLRRKLGASGSRGFSSSTGAGTAEAGGWMSHRKPLSKSISAMVNFVSGGVTAGSAARRNSASLAATDFWGSPPATNATDFVR